MIVLSGQQKDSAIHIHVSILPQGASLVAQMVKEFTCNAGNLGSIPGSGRPPGVGNGKPLQYSCWETPWTEEPGGLQSMVLQRVGQDCETNTILPQTSFPPRLPHNIEQRSLRFTVGPCWFKDVF